MVKHVILWQLKDELSDAEKAAVKAGIKEGLEGLAGKVPGLVEVHVDVYKRQAEHQPEDGTGKRPAVQHLPAQGHGHIAAPGMHPRCV